MSRDNRNTQSGSGFAMVLTLAILACWFFGFTQVLECVAAGTAAAGAILLLVLSIAALVRCDDNRPLVQFVAIRAAAVTYLALFAFGLVNAGMFVIEQHQRAIEMQAHLEYQHMQMEAQCKQLEASLDDMVVLAQLHTDSFDKALEAISKGRKAR